MNIKLQRLNGEFILEWSDKNGRNACNFKSFEDALNYVEKKLK